MEAAVITAIGTAVAGVVAAMARFLYSMWHDHTELAKVVVAVVQNNAAANEKLVGAVQANTKSTDQFSKLLLTLAPAKKTKRKK